MYRHPNQARLVAMYQASRAAAPLPDDVVPEGRARASPPPPVDALRAASWDSPSNPSKSLGKRPAAVVPTSPSNSEDECKTLPSYVGLRTSDSDSSTSGRSYRGKSAWKSPPPLPVCPFDTNTPCCAKGTPCYKYFKEEVATWRKLYLYNGNEDENVTRERLSMHRTSTTLPCGRNYCVKFQSYWSGWDNQKLYGRSGKSGGMSRQRRQSVKDVAVIAWFGILKDCLEQMPDNPTYQLGAPLRTDVYTWYMQDHDRLPTLYPRVAKPYFNKVWRTHVPEVRLRRVLRFTKCKTCESKREARWDRSSSQVERDQALVDLHEHYKFIKAERGYALMKAHRGVTDHKRVLSIAQDGTSQLPNGVPQFAQALHGQEQAHNRLHHHLTLTMVHGMGTKCYVTRDNIAGDPNLTIECLQRTLEWVEEVRGTLPPQLYVQVDNCWRENKNSSLVNWLASLVERGLFPGGIELGFLPVGHTHNEVDQIASRISVALRRRDIHTPAQLMAMLKECFVGLDVELLTKVADTKSFLNPGQNEAWKDSRWKRHQNISDHRFFLITKHATGDVHVCTKAQYNGTWSRPTCPIKGQGPELTKAKGPRVSQQEGYGPNVVKVREEAYINGVRKSLELCRVRVTKDEYEELQLTYQEIFDARPTAFHWANGGVFRTEEKLNAGLQDIDSDDDRDDEEIDTTGASGLFQHWNQVKVHRVRPEPESICVGFMVAVDGNADVGKDAPPAKYGFRMGKVVRVNRLLAYVTVQWLCTHGDVFKQKQVWRPWLARTITRVQAEHCFYTFLDLTIQGRLRAGNFRSLKYVLDGRAADMELSDLRAGVALIVPPAFDVNDISGFQEEDAAELGTEAHKLLRQPKRKRKGQAQAGGKVAASDGDCEGSSSSSSSSESTFPASSSSSSSASSNSSNSSSSSSSSSSPSSSSSSSSDSSASTASSEPDPASITARWFDDKCRGEPGCSCNFDWCLVPGASAAVVTGVWNHNRAKAQACGEGLSQRQHDAEWARLEELTFRENRRQRNT